MTPDGALPPGSTIGMLGGIASIAVFAIASVMLLTGKARNVPWKPFNAVLGITVFGVVATSSMPLS